MLLPIFLKRVTNSYTKEVSIARWKEISDRNEVYKLHTYNTTLAIWFQSLNDIPSVD